jgi:hypothetical protein
MLLFYYDCPKLQELYIHCDKSEGRVHWHVELPNCTRASNEVAQMPFPVLKKISCDIAGNQPLLLFEAFSFPTLAQVQLSALRGLFRLRDLPPSTLATKRGLATAPLQMFELHNCNIDLLAELLSITNLEAIQDLCISEHREISTRKDIDKTNTTFALPNLRHLQVEGHTLRFFEWVFFLVKSGEESIVLSFLPHREVLDDSLANPGNAMPQVHTLVVKGAPPLTAVHHSQKLFNLCPNTRRLIFEEFETGLPPGYGNICPVVLWPSVPITSHLEVYESLPQLEEVIIEVERFHVFPEQFSNAEIRKMVDSWLSSPCDGHRGPGAAPLKSITFRVISDYEPPFVEEYPWREGIVFRFEMIGKLDRLKYDLWAPQK